MIVHLHSDDMGATHSVTARMLDAWRAGALSGFSVLANGAACDEMAESLRAEPQRPARIACHLNLSEGRPSAPAESVPLLVDESGVLRHTFGSLIVGWLRHGEAFRKQVEIEWRAQIARSAALVAPRRLTVVDGHMHIHMLPFLFPVAARLAREAAIPEIRISREPFFVADGKDVLTRFFAVNFIKHAVLRVCAAFASPIARQEGLRAPARIVGVLYTGDMNVRRALAGLQAATRARAEAAEVVFHVGRAIEGERSRWSNRDFIASFYCDPLRDSEYDEIGRLAALLPAAGYNYPPTQQSTEAQIGAH